MNKILVGGITTGVVLLFALLAWMGPIAVGVTLGAILVIILVTFLWVGSGRSTTTSSAGSVLVNKVKANWKTVARVAVILVGCHLLVWYFWPGLWWNLAKTPVFWLDHAVLILAFLFLREGTGGKKKFVAGTGWLLAILVLGNVWTVWGWGESRYATARAKAVAERQQAVVAKQAAFDALPRSFVVEAPAGGAWSARVPTLHGESWETEGPIYVRKDNYEVFEDNPGPEHPVVRTNWLQFRSRTQEAVKVTISR